MKINGTQKFSFNNVTFASKDANLNLLYKNLKPSIKRAAKNALKETITEMPLKNKLEIGGVVLAAAATYKMNDAIDTISHFFKSTKYKLFGK